RECAGVRRALPPQRRAGLPPPRPHSARAPLAADHRAAQGREPGERGGDLATPSDPPGDRWVLARLLRMERRRLLSPRPDLGQLDGAGKRRLPPALVRLLG